MKIEEKLGYLLAAEALFLAAILISVTFVNYTPEQFKHVWEVIPSILAAMITTYGLKEMKSLT